MRPSPENGHTLRRRGVVARLKSELRRALQCAGRPRKVMVGHHPKACVVAAFGRNGGTDETWRP